MFPFAFGGSAEFEKNRMLLHPDSEAGSNSRGWPCSASTWLGFYLATKSVYWWRDDTSGSWFRSVVALYLVTSSFALLYLKRVASELVGHGSYLEAGVLE